MWRNFIEVGTFRGIYIKSFKRAFIFESAENSIIYVPRKGVFRIFINSNTMHNGELEIVRHKTE